MISQNNTFHEQLKCFQLCNTKVNNTKETFRRHNHAQKRQQKTSGSAAPLLPSLGLLSFWKTRHTCAHSERWVISARGRCVRKPKTMNHIRFLKVTYFSRFVFYSWNELSCFSDYKNSPVLSIIAGMGFLFAVLHKKKLPLSYGH